MCVCHPPPKPKPSPWVPADPCYRPLGIAALPDRSFTASAAQAGTPAHAARLHGDGDGDIGQELRGWAPSDDAYAALPSHPPFLQLDLLEPTNVTGGCPPGAARAGRGAADADPCPVCPGRGGGAGGS